MQTQDQQINLFIIDDNTSSAVSTLKQYLQIKFGSNIKIATFNDRESCLKKIDNETHIVILDSHLNNKDDLDIVQSIKAINDRTQVIVLSNNEDVGAAIEAFRMGAKSYVIKRKDYWGRTAHLIDLIFMTPIRIISREFGVSKFVAIFFMTFITMGIVVYIALQMMK